MVDFHYASILVLVYGVGWAGCHTQWFLTVLTVLALDLASIKLNYMSDVCLLVAVRVVELREGARKFAESTASADTFVKH